MRLHTSMRSISYCDLEEQADREARAAWDEAWEDGMDEYECEELADEAREAFIAAWWEAGDDAYDRDR